MKVFRLDNAVKRFSSSGSAMLLGLFLLLISAFIFLSPERRSEAATTEEEFSADIVIPMGYVLIPIEIQNQQSLDSILGARGIVDLFLPASDARKKPVLIAEKVKLLRAPLNPNQFAVLIQEEQSSQLLQSSDPYVVLVHNPKRRGTRFPSYAKPQSRIQMETSE